jgi:hypothetical protein
MVQPQERGFTKIKAIIRAPEMIVQEEEGFKPSSNM